LRYHYFPNEKREERDTQIDGEKKQVHETIFYGWFIWVETTWFFVPKKPKPNPTPIPTPTTPNPKVNPKPIPTPKSLNKIN
jgi:hypothetical protein